MHPVAILSAMDQEISSVERLVADPVTYDALGRRFRTGSILGCEVVTAITGYGKVAAAATTAVVLNRFQPRMVVFAGVAGGIGRDVNIGDVVVADHLIQHDYDASPIFDPYVIPSLGVAEIPTNPDLTEQLVAAVSRFVHSRASTDIEAPSRYARGATGVHRGLVASGDRFISDPDEAADLRRRLPSVLAVEMEGAAVAQVCAESRVPFALFRIISDRADADAAVDFLSFVSTVSAPFAAGIVGEFLTTC
jgi:adenosylhomocysteine nucleosidase